MSRNLLELSRSYAAGQLDQQAYRRLRLRLIRRLLQASGDQTLTVRVAGSGATGVDSTRDSTPTQAMALGVPERWMNRVLVTGLLLSVLVFVAVLGVRLLAEPRSTAAHSPEALVSAAASKAAPLQRHLAALLSQERWSRVQLQQFSRAWQASTATVRQQTRQDPRYRQLVALLVSQVQVLEALDPEGVDAAITDRIRLLEQLQRQVSAEGSALLLSPKP
jgi:hypothetical protein